MFFLATSPAGAHDLFDETLLQQLILQAPKLLLLFRNRL
jgi:hypothetical protein